MKFSFIKRLVSSATSLVMITSCYAGTITTSAAQQTWSMSDGKITLTLNDEGTELAVTGTGAMEDYTMATKQPYNNSVSNVTEIDIQSGITAVGKFNFGNNFEAVETVTIADTVTKIGASAFIGCTKATIDIMGTLTAANIGNYAFGNSVATYVKKIIVHDQGTSEAVKSKTGNGKVDVELQADAGSLKTELENLIKTTKETYKQEDYTVDTYKTLSEALTKAEGVISNSQATADNITEAINAINEAVKKLVSVVEGLKTELQSAIDKAKAIILTGYTTSSKAALNKAISDAEAAIKESGVTKEKLTQAKTALEAASAIDETGVAETGLKRNLSSNGASKRDDAIKNAATIISSKDGYTEESYDVYKKAYDKLIELFNKGANDTTDGQIDAAITDLDAAKEQLVPVEINLNTKEYEAIKKEIEDILNNDNSPYTENSLRGATNSLTSIYNFQLSFVEDKSGKIKDGVVQSQIDSATNILKNAIDLENDKCILVEKGNLTKLTALVESTKNLVEANYTAETWTALSDELTKANALINDPNNAAKADVEASEKALKAAIDALKYKSADYKAVDDALAKVPSDLSKYTDETVKALQNAINAVDRNKNITEQADVDAFAKAIENAIAGLKLKPASLSQKPGTSGKSTTVKSAAQLKAEKAMNQAKITKLTVKSKAKKTIVVKWNKVKNAKGYQIQVSTKRNFKKLILNKKSLKKNKITVKNKKLKKGKKYFVRVRAYATYKNSKGVTKKAYSSWNKKLRTVKIK